MMTRLNALSTVWWLALASIRRSTIASELLRRVGSKQFAQRVTLLVVLMGIAVPATAMQQLQLGQLRVEGSSYPLGLDEPNPRFSWKFRSSADGVLQIKYRVVVWTSQQTDSGEQLKQIVWDSKMVFSSNPFTLYGGKPLQSRRRYHWSVEIWTNLAGAPIARKGGWFETAFLSQEEWKAKWIAGPPRIEKKPTEEEGLADDSCCKDAVTRLVANSPKGSLSIDIANGNGFSVGRMVQIGSQAYKISTEPRAMRDGEINVSLASPLQTTYPVSTTVTALAQEFCRPVGTGKGGRKDTQGECLEVRPVPRFRKAFFIEATSKHGRVTRARLYSAGLGYNKIWINGIRASNNELDPNFTNYSKTVLYSTLDITPLLTQRGQRPSENVLAAELGSGQFDQDADGANWAYISAEWRERPRLKATLMIDYADGTSQHIDSANSWQMTDAGPIRYAGLYRGETHDARREQPGWNKRGFDSHGWLVAELVGAPAGTLRAAMGIPTQVVANWGPGRHTNLKPGVIVYDTGQERAGWATIAVSGVVAGTAIEIHYSDQTDAKGEVDSSGCCIAGQVQTDYYIAKGNGTHEHPEIYAPQFSYKGFQYIELSAPHEAPLPASADVRVLSVQEVRTAMREVGEFTSSNPRLNKLEHMVRASIAENYVAGIITDTPEYEKNAWTGDASLTAPTATLMFDTELQYWKSFSDMRDAQQSSGEVTLLAPGAQGYGRVGGFGKAANCCGATPIWDSFWFVLPWESYMRYGDQRSLEVSYPLMKKYLREWIPLWVDKDGDDSPYTLRSGLGDWDPPRGKEGAGPTAILIPPSIYSSTTAYYAYLTTIAANCARILGEVEDARAFTEDFAKIREAYNRKWWDAAVGYYHEAGEKTLYQEQQITPLAFGLVPTEERAGLQRKLIADILDTRDGHEEVGIVGSRWIFPVLSQAAEEGVPRAVEAAYAIATQRTYPSYGYWMDAGWTSLGENWERSSRTRTHHMYGAVGQWLYENLAGIQAIEPGYRKILFAPILPTKLESASATYDSVRGPIRSSWVRHQCDVDFTFSVPPNATAIASLPVQAEDSVREIVTGSGGRAAFVAKTAYRSSYSFGSGTHRFHLASNLKESASCRNESRQ